MFMFQNTTMKVAFITGIAGQDGSFLAEFLLSKGYKVIGLLRRSSQMQTFDRLKTIQHNKDLELIYGDVTDMSSIMNGLRVCMSYHSVNSPIEIYNLAAQSHVKVSFSTPIYTANADGLGLLNLLEAILMLGIKDKVRVYQASTSELFGSTPPPQNEKSPMCPQSPYAIAKLFAYWIVKNYRDAHNMFVVNGILFNHESERRTENFVSRKITVYVAKYVKGLVNNPLELGNLYAKRDWGYAKDFVEAMWLMLQRDKPEDLVIATGLQYSVKEFATIAFKVVGIDLEWKNDEAWYKDRLLIKVNPAFFRPTEVESLCGDPSYAKQVLSWEPKTKFEDLVQIMITKDLQVLNTQ